MDWESRTCVWRTKLAMVHWPMMFYLAVRFWLPATENDEVVLCNSRFAMKMSIVLTVMGLGLFVLTAMYACWCALKRAHEDGRWIYLPTDLRVWASEEKVNPIVYIGIGLLSCGAIELLHRLCWWLSR